MGWPQPVVPVGAAPTGDCPLRVGPGCSLAVGGRHCMGAGCGWPPLLLAAFTTKTQQERVERLYVIQSYHTQFKINLSHENLGSDTTVGKPQQLSSSIESRFGRDDWELAWSVSGPRRRYRELTRMVQGSSPKEDRDSLKDCRG
ncbi:hypothetical protein BHM03_00048452 [Ensete ventricosum]|nr:hypothetical protein BHM03_00048452 [Ensete ventricosum]